MGDVRLVGRSTTVTGQVPSLEGYGLSRLLLCGGAAAISPLSDMSGHIHGLYAYLATPGMAKSINTCMAISHCFVPFEGDLDWQAHLVFSGISLFEGMDTDRLLLVFHGSTAAAQAQLALETAEVRFGGDEQVGLLIQQGADTESDLDRLREDLRLEFSVFREVVVQAQNDELARIEAALNRLCSTS